ncbi:hypothetical protein M3210_04285 [Oceanobacillus luteolus]|uniref:Spore coat protein n=1 Tax=Oceanobacillus luteolus TaxID=1274358 RepID=A0ABW4HNL8_9BACI|nr:hypothetical protein [Oceanobacillus luteolus]MCM3739482.1 hypothetical protein [Oceanobacillus luteolus]
MKKKLALHERMELQEVLALKNLSLTKAAVMQGLVGCEELKNILTMEVSAGKQHVDQINELLKSREVVM